MNHKIKAKMRIINQQIKEFLGVYHDAMLHLKISENEFWIWYALIIMDDEYTQQDLCNEWSLSKQTVNSVILNMVKKGYVTLEVVPGTRNRKIIRLTPAGKTYGEQVIMPVFEAEQRALDRIPEEEKAYCMEILKKYVQYLKEELQNEESKEKS